MNNLNATYVHPILAIVIIMHIAIIGCFILEKDLSYILPLILLDFGLYLGYIIGYERKEKK